MTTRPSSFAVGKSSSVARLVGGALGHRAVFLDWALFPVRLYARRRKAFGTRPGSRRTDRSLLRRAHAEPTYWTGRSAWRRPLNLTPSSLTATHSRPTRPPRGGERRVALQARQQTTSMLRWWHDIAAVDRVDLAVRRSSGEMLWHLNQSISDLPLRWLRAENVRRGDIYLRPARGPNWALVFLDDVERRLAIRMAAKYDCAVIETSPPGGCHVWLRCTQPLSERQRRQAQRWLAQRAGADLGSVSGEHLGRLAGMKNWKRRGVWVNVLALATTGRAWDPQVVPGLDEAAQPIPRQPRRRRGAGRDLSPSGRDWAWVCSQLERGADNEDLTRRLTARATPRRGTDARRYARHTVKKAVRHVANPR